MRAILVVTSDSAASSVINSCFDETYDMVSVTTQAAMRKILAKRSFSYIFVDLDILRAQDQPDPKRGYKKGLQYIWAECPHCAIIVMAQPERIRRAVETVKAGAGDYLTYPLIPTEVKYVRKSLYEYAKMESELEYLRDSFWQGDFSRMARTYSPCMKKVLKKVKVAAPTHALIFLTGETGTGKSVIARLIHNHSTRVDKPFISVNCGAIPDTLIESELFGHEKGAFTGAVSKKLGKFELAHKGTIFLDEIGTLTPMAQVKLLQVLQDKTFQRLGGEIDRTTDARVIAATNLDLHKLSQTGEFRADLFYRLNVFPVEVPPLRERKEDIPLLVETFLERLNSDYSKEIYGVHPRVLEALKAYEWPGNVRELENLVERAYILEDSHVLSSQSFPTEFFPQDQDEADSVFDISLTLAEFREQAKESAEKLYLKELLCQHKGRINKSAEHAGVTTRQLHKLLTKYNIHKENFK